LLVTNNLSGSPVTLFTIPSGNLTIYRVTATVSAGVTTWSYAVSPAVYSTTTVANNLLLSADLQNTYISSINRVQFNTGDVYFASPIYAPNAYFDNVILNNANASTLSSVNVNAGNIKALAISTNSITTNTLTTNSLITTAITVPAISTNRISTAIINVSSMITPAISTLTQINNRSISLLFNPGDKIVFSQVNQSGGTGWYTKDIDLTNFQYGVYTAIAICRNNNFRTLSCTVNYSALYGVVANQSAGLDNNNGVKWSGSGIFLRFQSQTDGPGDTFDFQIWWTIGQTKSLGELPPEASTLQSMSTATFYPALLPWISQLSSIITTSSITIGSDQNISILANFAPAPFFSTGSILLAGTNDVSIVGDAVAVGGFKDVNVEGLTGDVNLSAASTIRMTAPFINAGTAALGTPSAFGSNFAYFGNSSRATNGSEYALLQENSGRTFLNAPSGSDIRFRIANTDVMTMDANGLYMSQKLDMNCNAISNVGAFSRYMISTEIQQPVIQYAYVSTTGATSGTITITLPQRYTSVNSYIPYAVVQNDVTTTFYVSTNTRATFEIGWDGFTGFGDIIFSWQTLGT
jgi:hypothetical protein